MSNKVFYSTLAAGLLGVSLFALSNRVEAQPFQPHSFSENPDVSDYRGYGRGHYGMGQGRHMMGHRKFGPGKMYGFHGFNQVKFFERFDINGDGKVDRPELSKALDDEFTRYNTSKSGQLSQEEFKKYWEDRQQFREVRAFQFFDRDGNNEITKDEIAAITKKLELFDDDEDYPMDKSDFRPGPNGRHFSGRHPGRYGSHRGFGGHKGYGGHWGFGSYFSESLKTADANKDGFLSGKEKSDYLVSQFEAADVNKDGKVSKEEFSALWQTFTEPMRIRAFQRLDRNDDNLLSKEEYRIRAEEWFASADQNADGIVDRSEMKRPYWYGSWRDNDQTDTNTETKTETKN